MGVELKTVITHSSVWKFDMTLKRYIRFPRNETLEHPFMPYSDEWIEFESVSRIKDKAGTRLAIHVANKVRLSGDIITDDLGELDD